MYLEFWRREICETAPNNWVVRELYINKSQFGAGDVITKDIYKAETKTACVQFCFKNGLTINEGGRHFDL